MAEIEVDKSREQVDGWAESSAFDDRKDGFSGIERLERLMQKNIEMTEEILDVSRKTKKYIFWGNVSGWLKILLIIAPLIIAIVYLPPILKDAFKQIQTLISGDINLLK